MESTYFTRKNEPILLEPGVKQSFIDAIHYQMGTEDPIIFNGYYIEAKTQAENRIWLYLSNTPGLTADAFSSITEKDQIWVYDPE